MQFYKEYYLGKGYYLISKIIVGFVIGALIGVGTVADIRDNHKVEVVSVLVLTGCTAVYIGYKVLSLLSL